MKKFKLLTLIISVFLLVSCGNKKKNDLSNQVVNSFINSGIRTLDISKAADTYSSTILGQVVEGLTVAEIDSKGNTVIVPGLAKSWEVSDNNLVWTFHLRNAFWSDGEPVKAQDFEYSIKRTLNPKTASVYAFILAPIKGANEYNSGNGSIDNVGVKALDDKTLQFTLKSPTAYFLDLTYFKTLYPQRKDIVEKYGNQYGSKSESILATGPFKIVRWIPNSKISLTKNDKYWDKDSVKLSGLNFSIIQDPSAIMNALFSGQIDMASVSKPEWIKKLDKTGNYNVIKGYTGGTNFTLYNMNDKVFSNLKIRQAFSLATNRQEMADVIFKGIFEPAYGWVPPKTLIGNKEFRSEVPQPLLTLKAKYPNPKQLLIEGLKELGLSENPADLTITYLNAGTGEFSREYFEFIQQMWSKTLGIKVKGDFVEWPIYQARTEKGDYQLGGQAWIGDYNDPMTFFEPFKSDAGIYPNGFNNPRYDKLLTMADATIDQVKRLHYFKEAEQILLVKDAVIMPTLYRKRNTYINKKVKGIMIPPFATTNYKYAYISNN